MPQGAELTRRQQRLQVLVQRVGALVEEDAEGELRLGGRDVDELAGLPGVDADGLLDESVHPVLEGVDAHLRVQVVGHGGHDGVHVAGGHHLGVVGVERDTVGVGGLLLLGQDVADGPETHAGHPVVGQQGGVQATLSAEPDDAEPNRILRHAVRTCPAR